MEPTDQQASRLKYLRDSFGRQYVKSHAPDHKTGIMRVELTCLAGVHQWYFDESGNLIDRSITMRLFDMPVTPKPPRNALDN